MLRPALVGLAASGIVACVLAANWPSPPTLQWSWRPGATYEFKVDYRSNGQAMVEGLSASGKQPERAQSVASHLAGRLEITPLENTNEGALLLFHLLDVTGETIMAGQVPEKPTEITFRATMSSRGSFAALHFAPQSTPLLRNQLRALISSLQVTLPDSAQWRWHADEADLHGKFVADYAIDRFSGQRPAFRKAGRVREGSGEHTNAPIRSGKWTGTFDPEAGFVTSLEGNTSVSIQLGHMNVGAEHSTFSLSFVGKHLLTDLALARLKATDSELYASGLPGTLEGTEEHEALAKVRDAEAVRGISLRGILDELALTENNTAEAQLPIFLQLKALLRTHPDAATGCAEALGSFDPDGRSFGTVAVALASVGHDEAQRALRAAVGNLGDQSHGLFRLVPYLGLVPHPDTETEALAREIAHSDNEGGVKRAALLALGNMGNSLRNDAAGRATAIFDEARGELKGAAAGEEQRFYLRVLGNLGHPRQVDVVRPLLAQAPTATRESAVDSLRFVDTPESETILQHHALHDGSANVRARALQAMAFSEMTPERFKVYRDVLRLEMSVPVVQEALRGLGRAAPKHPEALRALHDYLGTCGHPDLCAVARGEVQSNTM